MYDKLWLGEPTSSSTGTFIVQTGYLVLSFGKILTPILPFHLGVQIYSSKFSEKLKKLLEGRGGHGRKGSDRVTCDGIVSCLEQLAVFQDSSCNGNQDELCPAVMLNLYFNGYFNWQFFSIMFTDQISRAARQSIQVLTQVCQLNPSQPFLHKCSFNLSLPTSPCSMLQLPISKARAPHL